MSSISLIDSRGLQALRLVHNEQMWTIGELAKVDRSLTERGDLIETLNKVKVLWNPILERNLNIPGLNINEDASLFEIQERLLQKTVSLQKTVEEFESSPEGLLVESFHDDENNEAIRQLYANSATYRNYIQEFFQLDGIAFAHSIYSSFVRREELLNRIQDLEMLKLKVKIDVSEASMGSFERKLFQEFMSHPEIVVPDDALPPGIATLRALYLELEHLVESVISRVKGPIASL